MFHHANPRQPGRQMLSKIRNIQGDGQYIGVLNPDGSTGDPVVYFNAAYSLMYGTYANYEPYTIGSPAMGTLAVYWINKHEYGSGYCIRYRMCGYFNLADVSVDVYLDGNYIITARAMEGSGAWQVEIDVHLADIYTPVVYARATAPAFMGGAMYSNELGNMLYLDYGAEKTIEIVADDISGSGMACAFAMTVHVQPIYK